LIIGKENKEILMLERNPPFDLLPYLPILYVFINNFSDSIKLLKLHRVSVFMQLTINMLSMFKK